PRHLAFLVVPQLPCVPHQFRVKARRHARSSEFFHHAQSNYSDGADLPLIVQDLDETRRKKFSVRRLQRHVHVRQRQSKTYHTSGGLPYQNHFRLQDLLHFLALEEKLFPCHRDKAPVLLPGGIVDVPDACHFSL